MNFELFIVISNFLDFKKKIILWFGWKENRRGENEGNVSLIWGKEGKNKITIGNVIFISCKCYFCLLHGLSTIKQIK